MHLSPALTCRPLVQTPRGQQSAASSTVVSQPSLVAATHHHSELTWVTVTAPGKVPPWQCQCLERARLWLTVNQCLCAVQQLLQLARAPGHSECLLAKCTCNQAVSLFTAQVLGLWWSMRTWSSFYICREGS
jgi:hypothetical protein